MFFVCLFNIYLKSLRWITSYNLMITVLNQLIGIVYDTNCVIVLTIYYVYQSMVVKRVACHNHVTFFCFVLFFHSFFLFFYCIALTYAGGIVQEILYIYLLW